MNTPSQNAAALQHSAFYRFVDLPEPGQHVEWLRHWCGASCPSLLGSIVVAGEGISGAVSAELGDLERFEQGLRDDPHGYGLLTDLRFQRSGCKRPALGSDPVTGAPSTRQPYGRLKIVLRPEIVAFGNPAAGQRAGAGSHLGPAAWRDLLSQAQPLLIDNRNSFEYRLGHFRNAVDPQVENFRAFADHVQRQLPAWRASGRPVAMYCTGGIRCEKTAGWMQGLGLEVYQLQGGILNFLASLPDAERDWQGECFVFDQRIALDSRLQPSGTTADAVYRADLPGEAWRLSRARQLAATAAC